MVVKCTTDDYRRNSAFHVYRSKHVLSLLYGLEVLYSSICTNRPLHSAQRKELIERKIRSETVLSLIYAPSLYFFLQSLPQLLLETELL